MIYPLPEGEFTIGHDKIFVPFDTANDVLNDRPGGSLLVEVQPFLVTLEDEVILLDTGLGFANKDGKMMLHAALEAHGFRPEDVSKVLMSHLHKDHAGGMLRKEGSGAVKPTFPSATYFIYRPEADYALEVGYPSYHPEELKPLFASGQVVWLDGSEGRINEYITFQHSGAHCPQHIVFFVDHEGDTVFYGGDEAPQLKQMKFRYVAKYDFDGKKAMQLREAWAEEGHKQGWTALFYHDVKCPVAKL